MKQRNKSASEGKLSMENHITRAALITSNYVVGYQPSWGLDSIKRIQTNYMELGDLNIDFN